MPGFKIQLIGKQLHYIINLCIKLFAVSFSVFALIVYLAFDQQVWSIFILKLIFANDSIYIWFRTSKLSWHSNIFFFYKLFVLTALLLLIITFSWSNISLKILFLTITFGKFYALMHLSLLTIIFSKLLQVLLYKLVANFI